MRFSLFIVVFAALSPILAAPMPGKKDANGRKLGTNVQKKEAHEIPEAAVGDIVLAQSKDFKGEDAGSGSSKRKVHPGIVLEHDPRTHIVGLAAIGHEHPGDVRTMPGSLLGLPETPDKTAQQSLVSLGPLKRIDQKDLKPLKDLPVGSEREPMPHKLADEHLALLRKEHEKHNPPAAEPEKPTKPKKSGEKEKEKKSEKKSKRELDFDLVERYLLESMFDDEW